MHLDEEAIRRPGRGQPTSSPPVLVPVTGSADPDRLGLGTGAGIVVVGVGDWGQAGTEDSARIPSSGVHVGVGVGVSVWGRRRNCGQLTLDADSRKLVLGACFRC